MSSLQHPCNSGVATLTVHGRFDAQLAPQIQQEFDALLTAGARFIILDLTGVNSIDSGGLALLVRGMKRCRERNGELLLCGPGGPVRNIFELTRIDRAFRIFDDPASAQAALAGQ